MACQKKEEIKNGFLNYYNQYLFDNGVINEKERNKMTVLIASNVRSKPNIKVEQGF